MLTDLGQTETLIQPVVARARCNPSRRCVLFINEDGSQQEISASLFHQLAMQHANALRAAGVRADDLVVLVLRHSPELLLAFWGAMYLEAIPAIFPFLTEKLDPTIYMEQVRALIARSGARAVITFPEFEPDLARLLAELDCRVLSADDILRHERAEENFPTSSRFRGDRTAFLQHSSGTTGLQKGVALSHRAVLDQIEAYSQAIGANSGDVIVSWLPLYHDMGLIAGFIMPVVLGIPLVLLSPFHWVRDPKILLWAIHEQRGTLAWLPNFAYNHCVRSIRPRDLVGLDLTCWRAAINCSEPVRFDSHRLFLERFAPYGFRGEALASCYAMAENTFAVTQSPLGRPPHVDWVNLNALQAQRRAVPVPPGDSHATPVVSCGVPIQGTAVAVVDDSDQLLPDRHVGEIILRGNSMLSEYYRRPDLTSQAIRGGWYNTGDMGYLAAGHLYVSGRKKDMIIVGGRNIYPQDLEAVANAVPGITPGRAVAFGLLDEKLGSERIVMVCERDGSVDGIDLYNTERQLRQQVVRHLDVTLDQVRLVERRWLIKTSSGKLARAANRDKYLRESGETQGARGQSLPSNGAA